MAKIGPASSEWAATNGPTASPLLTTYRVRPKMRGEQTNQTAGKTGSFHHQQVGTLAEHFDQHLLEAFFLRGFVEGDELGSGAREQKSKAVFFVGAGSLGRQGEDSKRGWIGNARHFSLSAAGLQPADHSKFKSRHYAGYSAG